MEVLFQMFEERGENYRRMESVGLGGQAPQEMETQEENDDI